MDVIAQLKGTVKHYDWGGYSFIPSLLSVDNGDNKPFAEYWLGVHPQAGCRVVLADGSEKALSEFISKNSMEALGQYVNNRFGNIPYLLKVLDVKDMLSIQVHPSKADAKKDFAAENEKKIPLDSAQRNYKDDNHKPELMVAMGDFWLLHGFKPEAELKRILSATPELQSLLPVFEESGYKGLYKHVMQLPQEEVNNQLQPLLDRIIPLYNAGELDKSQENYWAAKGALTFAQPGKTDRGIFSVYLFNLVQLHRGEAIFQDAGVPHAYLFGQNVEIMASSDNVLRGGLTNKHIDVQELLKHVKCEPTFPNVLTGEKSGDELVYTTPAPDFELGSFNLSKMDEVSFTAATAELLLLVEGRVEIKNKDNMVVLEKGSPSAIALPGDRITVKAFEKALLFKASVPEAH